MEEDVCEVGRFEVSKNRAEESNHEGHEEHEGSGPRISERGQKE